MLNNLPNIDPMKLSLRDKPFDDPEFIFELKHDGFRALAYVSDGLWHVFVCFLFPSRCLT
jgi:hypothetical protein